MAKSTRQYVFEGMELIPTALIPFVEKRLETAIKGHWQLEVVQRVQGLRPNSTGNVGWDQQGLLKTMMAFWKEAFATVLGFPERSYVSELLDVRNKLSHNETFTYDDAERALDTMRRLMESISAGEIAAEIGKMRDTILRTKFTELARNEERRKSQRLEISVETVAGLLPWREVVEPHDDVATGDFQQAEFAADLAKVHSCSRVQEAVHAGLSGAKLAPVMVTSRPPGARRASAEATWRKAASRMRPSTWAMTENGGFISTTVGTRQGSRWSSIWAASKRVTERAGKREESRPARISASSLTRSVPPAISARMARSPVPAEGSSTRSAGVIAAAVTATKPSGIGVDKRVELSGHHADLIYADTSATNSGALQRRDKGRKRIRLVRHLQKRRKSFRR